jgi:OFA family oxalate/formate antiporter-like MFS transporter
MSFPPAGYVPPLPATTNSAQADTRVDWKPTEMLGTAQFFGLVLLFLGSAQSGLLVIANAQRLTNFGTGDIAGFAAQAWLLASVGAVVNAAGRIGTGFLSDRIGRANAYLVNGVLSAASLFLMPTILRSGSVPLLFAAVMIAYWQYGGGLSLLPAWTADFFGPRNLGVNYGLVFLGWGIAFFVPQTAAYIEDARGSLDDAFYVSGGLLLAALVVCCLLRKPTKAESPPDGITSLQ